MAESGRYERERPPSATAETGALPSILIQVLLWAEAEGKEPGGQVPERYLTLTHAHIVVVCISGN